MADSLDTRDEEKLLECGICCSRLNDPRKLDCRHAFCFTCIKEHYKICGKRLAPCPICRKLYPSLDVSVDDLPQCTINFHQLLDTRNSRHSCESELCLSSNAPFLCLKCKKWLCFKCTERKDETSSCRSHEAYRISDMDARLYNIIIRSRKKTCTEHPHYDVQWFCMECNVLGCNHCKVRQPLTHRLIEVEKKATELRGLFTDVCIELQRQSEEHQKASGFFHKICERLSPLGICDVHVCEESARVHKADVSECESLMQIMNYLKDYATDEVLVSIYLNMEDQIASEIEKQPLKDLGNIHWLGDNTEGKKSTKEGNALKTLQSNRRQSQNDTDISKKISVVYFCNLLAMMVIVLVVLAVVLSLTFVVYYWSDLWQGIKHKFYISAVDFVHSKLEGMLKEAFKPELISQYQNITQEFVSRFKELENDSMSKFLEFFKMIKHEYCNKDVRYSSYGGDIRLHYQLYMTTFCGKD